MSSRSGKTTMMRRLLRASVEAGQVVLQVRPGGVIVRVELIDGKVTWRRLPPAPYKPMSFTLDDIEMHDELSPSCQTLDTRVGRRYVGGALPHRRL